MQNKTQKTVLLADDDASILIVLMRALKARGYKVMTTENLTDVDAWVNQGLGDVIITDVTMPRGNGLDGVSRWQARRPELPVIVMSAHNTLLNAARAQDLGAVTFLPQPFDLSALLEAVENATHHLPRPMHQEATDGTVRISDELVLIGKSPAMQKVFATLAKLIGNDLTVLISGESGTGKEKIARALHALSRRKTQPFIALNMAAIPRELIESALFGHEKGSFTGAHQKQLGAFTQAHGGTLFLDEIGDMPMEAQTRLLRVLQEQQVTPVGSNIATKTDVRVVAATHRDLRALVNTGAFREDLYFRLHVVPLALPGLREHVQDIPLLVEHFMREAVARGLSTKKLDASALDELARHDWPGNVRELEHLVYRLCALNASTHVTAADIAPLLVSNPTPVLVKSDGAGVVAPTVAVPMGIEHFLQTQLRHYFAAHGNALPAPGLYDRILASIEKPLIIQTLRATGGNQIKAAEILGLNRNTLRKKMRELNIDAKQLVMVDAA